jgi:hypothetical protein
VAQPSYRNKTVFVVYLISGFQGAMRNSNNLRLISRHCPRNYREQFIKPAIQRQTLYYVFFAL